MNLFVVTLFLHGTFVTVPLDRSYEYQKQLARESEKFTRAYLEEAQQHARPLRLPTGKGYGEPQQGT